MLQRGPLLVILAGEATNITISNKIAELVIMLSDCFAVANLKILTYYFFILQ